MSHWSYITGSIICDCPGRTQEEIEYILKSVLKHLPRVTGSEGDMEVHIIKHDDYNISTSLDEYGHDMYYSKDHHLEIQSKYTLSLNAALRDRTFDITFREFMKWLVRLSKRIMVDSVLVRIDDYYKSYVINAQGYSAFYYMNEDASWYSDNGNSSYAWWEHLMWKRYKDYNLPLSLIKKYYPDFKEDEEDDT